MNWQDIRHNLYLFVVKRVDNPQSAEDIVQDILLKAVEKIDGLQDEEKFLPWLYKIARNTIIDHYRKKRPEQTLPEMLALEEGSTDSVLQELEPCVTSLMDKLPDKYRDALFQAHFTDSKLQDIADSEGVSLPAIKSRVQRGRQQLKAHLHACCTITSNSTDNIVDVQYPPECQSC